MVQKICPICDQVMHLPHYCPNCRSWVKHPYVRDVTYYLNERHPADEADCTYHQRAEHTTAAGGKGGGWTPMQETVPNRPNPAVKEAVPNRPNYPAKEAVPAGQDSPKRRKTFKNTGIIIIVLILVVIKLLGACASIGYEVVDRIVGSAMPDYDVDLGDFYEEPETGETDYAELEDEEVIAAGVACSSRQHFGVSGRELEEPLREIIKEHSLAVTDSNTYSYNEQYGDGSTWYATWTSFDLSESENGCYQSVELDYDTATEELHEIDIILEDPEAIADLTGDIVELLESRGALLTEENCAEILRREMPGMVRQVGYYELQSGNLYIEGELDEESCTVYIYHTEE